MTENNCSELVTRLLAESTEAERTRYFKSPDGLYSVTRTSIQRKMETLWYGSHPDKVVDFILPSNWTSGPIAWVKIAHSTENFMESAPSAVRTQVEVAGQATEIFPLPHQAGVTSLRIPRIALPMQLADKGFELVDVTVSIRGFSVDYSKLSFAWVPIDQYVTQRFERLRDMEL